MAWHGAGCGDGRLLTTTLALSPLLTRKTFPTPRAWERSDGEVNIAKNERKKRQVKLGLLSTWSVAKAVSWRGQAASLLLLRPERMQKPRCAF